MQASQYGLQVLLFTPSARHLWLAHAIVSCAFSLDTLCLMATLLPSWLCILPVPPPSLHCMTSAHGSLLWAICPTIDSRLAFDATCDPFVNRPATLRQSQLNIMAAFDSTCRGQVVTGGKLLSRSTVMRCWSSLSLKRTHLRRHYSCKQLPPALTQTKLTDLVTGWLTTHVMIRSGIEPQISCMY